MAYQIYNIIISRYYHNIILESKTDDYDISFSLINESDIKFIIDSIKIGFGCKYLFLFFFIFNHKQN